MIIRPSLPSATPLLLPLILLSVIAICATAQTAESPKVELSSSLTPQSGVVPGQRMRLTIEVATPRWFTGGTRIALPEVPGLVLLQNQDFASNATERRGSESWSVQRWTVDAFATRPGPLTIPPIEVTVSASISPSESRIIVLQTQAVSADIELPEALRALDHWIASPDVTLTETLEGEEAPYVGGAVSRQITITATDVMAMMLPAITPGGNDLLQGYPEPPVLRNRANRGVLSAERRDRITWIATGPGAAEIPGVRVNWWHTESRTLKVLTTDPTSLSISGTAPAKQLSRGAMIARALYAAGAVLLALLLFALWRSGIPRRTLRWLTMAWTALQRRWRVAWAPVLPEQLNPGGSPAEPSEASRPTP